MNSTNDELKSIISDMYKDAYGIRPRTASYWAKIRTCRDAYAEMDRLEVAIAASIAEQSAREAVNAEVFEVNIKQVIAFGAADRETAVRWLMDAEDVDGDEAFFAFSIGISYDYNIWGLNGTS